MARGTRLNVLTLFGDVASAASYSQNCGASNAIEKFEQSFDILLGPLVTILAIESFLQAVEKWRGPLVLLLPLKIDINALCTELKAGPPPLEAILVIFGRRALIFFLVESSWKK